MGKSKEEKEIEKAIELHRQALADAQLRADRATEAVNQTRNKAIAEQLRFRRPGQAAVAFLEPDPEMERLERARVEAAGTVYTLEKRLEQLGRMLAAERAKQ